MSPRSPKAYLPIAIAMVISAVVIAASISATSTPRTVTETSTMTQTSTITTTTVMAILSAPGETSSTFQCSITGQPGGFFIRVVYDSNQTPVAGAAVNATSLADYCNNIPATVPSTSRFTTSSSTEWYSLPYENIGGYSISVAYSGQIYTLSANTAPLSITCASISLPSGNVNVTQKFASSPGCPSP